MSESRVMTRTRENRNRIRIPDDEILRIPGDGNCGFSAITAGMDGVFFDTPLRQLVVNYIRSDYDYFSNSIHGGLDMFNRHLEDMQKDGTHIEYPEIVAAQMIARHNGYNIFIWHQVSDGSYERSDELEDLHYSDLEEINLVYRGDGVWGHYDLWTKNKISHIGRSPIQSNSRIIVGDNNERLHGYNNTYVSGQNVYSNDFITDQIQQNSMNTARIQNLEQQVSNLQSQLISQQQQVVYPYGNQGISLMPSPIMFGGAPVVPTNQIGNALGVNYSAPAFISFGTGI
jgi:hypothetical protein